MKLTETELQGVRQRLEKHLDRHPETFEHQTPVSPDHFRELVGKDKLLTRLGLLAFEQKQAFRRLIAAGNEELRNGVGLSLPRLYAILSALDQADTPPPNQREQDLRTWIAMKESVCPWAPGLAHCVHLPPVTAMTMENVCYFAEQLQAFYQAKVSGKRVGRLILLPHEEWSSHQQAHAESELIYWHLHAAYYHLKGDIRRKRNAMNQHMSGIWRGVSGEINNPVVGKLSTSKSSNPDRRSLFCTALAPTYRSSLFFRYAPYSCLVLVYAREFIEKKKHHNAIATLSEQMVYGNLLEVFGHALPCRRDQVIAEMPGWEALINRLLQLRVKQDGSAEISCAADALDQIRAMPPHNVNMLCARFLSQLPVMQSIMAHAGITAHQFLLRLFPSAGLYTIPLYSDVRDSLAQPERFVS